MRALVGLSLVALLGVYSPLDAEQRQTFVIQADIGHGRAEIASGVVVAADASSLTLATTAPILRLHRPLIILDRSRAAYYRVLETRISENSGLAYVKVATQPHFEVTPPQVAAPYNGEPVWIWGHPEAGFWVMSTGTIVQAVGAGIRVDCGTCAPGDGGAGAFDGFGRLVGVLNGTHVAGPQPLTTFGLSPASLVAAHW